MSDTTEDDDFGSQAVFYFEGGGGSYLYMEVFIQSLLHYK